MHGLNPTIVMAAGKGSRMRADADVDPDLLTEARSRPKAMIRIGRERRPLLEHLLNQLRNEGCSAACVVIAPDDAVTRDHFSQNPLAGMTLSFVEQAVPEGRLKPLGTAHAVELALRAHPEWDGASVTVANGDNLPPQGMFKSLFGHESVLPAFHPEHLGLPTERIQAFAVIHVDLDGQLTGITEKPDAAAMASARWQDGHVRVSMNYFRMPYAALLQAVCEVDEHPERGEKELPVAVSQWLNRHQGDMTALPLSGAFLDMTHPRDIAKAGQIVDQGGFALISRT